MFIFHYVFLAGFFFIFFLSKVHYMTFRGIYWEKMNRKYVFQLHEVTKNKCLQCFDSLVIVNSCLYKEQRHLWRGCSYIATCFYSGPAPEPAVLCFSQLVEEHRNKVLIFPLFATCFFATRCCKVSHTGPLTSIFILVGLYSMIIILLSKLLCIQRFC